MTTIMVTGAARGVGKALMQEGAKRGHTMVGSVRSQKDADGLKTELGDKTQVLIFDVADGDSIAEAARAYDGPLDILINNAGIIGPERQSTLDTDFDGFAETLSINTLGPLRVAQAFLPHIKKSGDGKIITISSQMGMMNYAKSDRIAYRASKSAVNKIMQGLATDLMPVGIAVQVLHPGWVRTDMGGPGADISPQESATGIMDRAEQLSMGTSGTFLNYDGATMPW